MRSLLFLLIPHLLELSVTLHPLLFLSLLVFLFLNGSELLLLHDLYFVVALSGKELALEVELLSLRSKLIIMSSLLHPALHLSVLQHLLLMLRVVNLVRKLFLNFILFLLKESIVLSSFLLLFYLLLCILIEHVDLLILFYLSMSLCILFLEVELLHGVSEFSLQL